jgi:hypothetical protein
MNFRSGLILRIFVLFVLVLVAFSPTGCVGCSGEGPSVRDSIEVTFPDRVEDVFSSENAFVSRPSGDYEPLRPDNRLNVIISPDSPPEIRLTDDSDFVVKLRPMHEGIRPEIVDGSIVYDFEGGAEIWTARNGGYEVTLFLEAGFVDNKPFHWNWQVSGSRIELADDQAAFWDEHQPRIAARLLDVQTDASEQIALGFAVNDSQLSMRVPGTSSATLVRIMVNTATNGVHDGANPPNPIAQACTLDFECGNPSLFVCVNGECRARTGVP